MAAYIEIEFVDYGIAGEYGFFGKIVARSDIRGMSAEEIEAEIAEMTEMYGDHIAARMVERV